MSETQDRVEAADKIIKKYRLIALGVGLIPIAFLDMAALAALQLKMLKDISEVYEIKFSENLGKSGIAALLSGAGIYPVNQLIKMLPITGWFMTFAGTSLFSAASTHAVGKVFIQHFASGGTFLTFDPEKVRDYYADQLSTGKKIVQESYAGQRP